MTRACLLAKESGSRLAAHPSYPDRAHFGRRSLEMNASELERSLIEQVSILAALANRAGLEVAFIKPHGALYHDAARRPEHAGALVAALRSLSKGGTPSLGLIGAGQGELRELALREGHLYLREGFADRGCASDGRLIPRGEPGALISDPEAAAQQALRLAESGSVDTICVHGDTEGSLAIARAVRQVLEERGRLT